MVSTRSQHGVGKAANNAGGSTTKSRTNKTTTGPVQHRAKAKAKATITSSPPPSAIKPEPTTSPAPSASSTSTTQPQSKPTSKPNSKSKSTLIASPTTPLPTPSLTSHTIAYTYAPLRGEQLVLTYEPYKSLLLPFWAFRTVPIAQSSCAALLSILSSYVERDDFVGADMSRKFLQMGMTRARRYANWSGGRKFVDGKGRDGSGEKRGRWEGGDEEERRRRREKEVASEVFRVGWRRCVEDEGYKRLKGRWMEEKREWERGAGKMVWRRGEDGWEVLAARGMGEG